MACVHYFKKWKTLTRRESSLTICQSDHYCWWIWCSVLGSVFTEKPGRALPAVAVCPVPHMPTSAERLGRSFVWKHFTKGKTLPWPSPPCSKWWQLWVLLQLRFLTLLFRSRVSKPFLSQMVNISVSAGQTLSVTKTSLCPLQHESSHRPYIHEWICLCPSKTF